MAKLPKNWAVFDHLFGFWQNFEPSLANFEYFWANRHSFDWPNIK